MMSDPKTRLPYKDDNEDSSYAVNPEEEKSLEDEVHESKEQA